MQLEPYNSKSIPLHKQAEALLAPEDEESSILSLRIGIKDLQQQNFKQSLPKAKWVGALLKVIVSVLVLSFTFLFISQVYIRASDRKYLEQLLQKTIFVGVDHQKTQARYELTDKYFFSASIRDMILNSEIDHMYIKEKKKNNITINQYMRSIIRTQLVHNINFGGEVQVQLSPFDKSLQEKQRAIRQIMNEQELHLESVYQLSKYNTNQLRFCLVIPSYNNARSKLYLRNLDSIFMQDYKNYHVVYIDDASPDKTGDFVKEYIEENKIPEEKIKVYVNKQNKKALFNIYHAIHNYCPDGEIVGLIDGDDSLIGSKVLQVYNAVYQAKKSAIVYSNFIQIVSNNRTVQGFGQQVTQEYYLSGQVRTNLSLPGTHFMTFFSDVFKKIKKQDLCYENGNFYDYAYDKAIITPIIQMSYPRVEYLCEMLYEYRKDTGINDGSGQWWDVAKLIKSSHSAYQSLKEFAFIDDFVVNVQKQNLKHGQSVFKKQNLKKKTKAKSFLRTTN